MNSFSQQHPVTSLAGQLPCGHSSSPVAGGLSSAMRQIIPNEWQDALAVAWRAECGSVPRRRRPTKYPAITEKGLAARRSIKAAAADWMPTREMAQTSGIREDSIEYHLRAMERDGEVQKRKIERRLHWRVVAP